MYSYIYLTLFNKTTFYLVFMLTGHILGKTAFYVISLFTGILLFFFNIQDNKKKNNNNIITDNVFIVLYSIT